MSGAAQERLAAWETFLQAHSVVFDRLEAEMERECGLPLSWYEVLLKLSLTDDGRLRMLDLSRSLLLSKSGVTRLIDRMVEAGLVERESSAQDRRVTWACISDRGRDRFRAAAPVHLRGIEEHFTGHLTDQEVRTLRKALLRVLEASGQPASACHSPSDFAEVARVRA